MKSRKTPRLRPYAPNLLCLDCDHDFDEASRSASVRRALKKRMRAKLKREIGTLLDD